MDRDLDCDITYRFDLIGNSIITRAPTAVQNRASHRTDGFERRPMIYWCRDCFRTPRRSAASVRVSPLQASNCSIRSCTPFSSGTTATRRGDSGVWEVDAAEDWEGIGTGAGVIMRGVVEGYIAAINAATDSARTESSSQSA